MKQKRASPLKSLDKLASSVKFKKKNDRIYVERKDETLSIIGSGRSAFAFKQQLTDQVIKVFYPPYEYLAKKEADIYKVLNGISYFPNMYTSGRNYLVIDFIEGHTLFECLTNGIPITKKHIKEIDRALLLAKERGLNPSDIHLHNLLISNNGDVKIIDVARFRQQKDCTQWEDLKKAFYKYYFRPFFPKKIPAIILNFISAIYKKKLFPKFLL